MGGKISKTTLPPDFDYIDKNHFVNEDNRKIYCRYWEPNTTTPKALVFISHGVGEHGGWYSDMAKHLNKQDLLVFSHDHVGHGYSEGERVHVNSMEEYYRDVIKHANIMKEKYPNTPMFLIGHSMGGTVAVGVVVREPDLFKGMVLVAPAIQTNPETATPFKVSLAKVVASVMPHFHVGQIESKWVSRNEEVRKRYDDDPLVNHKGVKARWSVCMLKALDEIKNRFEDITIPFLCLNGDQDKLCHVDGAKLLYKYAKSTDKTLEIYEGGFHQLHYEPDGMDERCHNDVCDWIVARL